MLNLVYSYVPQEKIFRSDYIHSSEIWPQAHTALMKPETVALFAKVSITGVRKSTVEKVFRFIHHPERIRSQVFCIKQKSEFIPLQVKSKNKTGVYQ